MKSKLHRFLVLLLAIAVQTCIAFVRPVSPLLPSRASGLRRRAEPRSSSSSSSDKAALTVDDSALGVNATIQERLDLFRRLAVPYFQQAEGAKLQFGLLLVLVLCQSGVSVIFSFVGRDFYSALSAKDLAVFQEKTANYAVGLAVATPLTVLYKFQRQRLALSWRQWMTSELAKQYYQDRAYYRVELDRDVAAGAEISRRSRGGDAVPAQIDNPDQRLTEDVAAFTKVSLDFFITVLTAVIDLASFSGILYSIYPNLFYAIFAYATFGSLTTVALGKTRPAPASFVFLFSRARTEARPPRSRRPERAAAAQGGGPALQPRAPARERGVDRVLRRRGPRGRGGRRAPRPRRGEQARDPGHAAEPRVLHDGVHVPRADPARARRVAALLRGHDRARRRDAVGGGVQINGASMAWGRVGSRTGRRAPSTTSSTT